jgi:hypothetical protein
MADHKDLPPKTLYMTSPSGYLLNTSEQSEQLLRAHLL